MTQPLWSNDAPGELELAARRQLDRLTAAGLLTEDHDIMRAAILSLAKTMSAAERKGASVGLSHTSKELREWFAMLPTPPAPDDEFTQLMRSLEGASR